MSAHAPHAGADAARRTRLSNANNFAPWIAPDTLPGDDRLLWLPVSGFPVTHAEKRWLVEFLDRCTLRLAREHRLRPEVFLEYGKLSAQAVPDFLRFMETRDRVVGLGRASDEDWPTPLTEEQLDRYVKTGQPPSFADRKGKFLLWFVNKELEVERELFAGDGSMTTVFLPQDPATKPPVLPISPALRAAHPAFRNTDPDRTLEAVFAKRDAFLQRSLQLCGKGWKQRPECVGMEFVVPHPESKHVFAAPDELRDRWFDLFPVILRESPEDSGILLAYKNEAFDLLFQAVVADMRDSGLEYNPRGRR